MHARQRRLLVLLALLLSTFIHPAAPTRASVVPPGGGSSPVSNTLGGATYTPVYPLPDTPPTYTSWEGDHTSPRNEAEIVNFNTIQGTGSNKTLPHVVTDTSGAMHAVFFRRPGAHGELYYSTSPAIDSGTQSAAVRIDDVPHPRSSNPALPIPVDMPTQDGQYARIAVDNGGGVHVVWVIDTQAWYRFCASNCASSAGWNTASRRMSEFESLNCSLYHPSIVAWKDANGGRHVTIVLERTGTGKNNILALQSHNGSWDQAVTPLAIDIFDIEPSPKPVQRTPVLALGPGDTPVVHLIWHQRPGDSDDNGTIDTNGLWYRQSPITSNGWSTPYLLAANNNATYNPMELFPDDGTSGVEERAYVNSYALTVDSNGGVHAAWPHGAITGNQEPWYAACASSCTGVGSGWSTPVNLATTADTNGLPGTMNHAIRLASDTSGRVGVVWRQVQPDGNVALVGTSWRADRGWKPLELLFRRPFAPASGAIAYRDTRNPDLGYASTGQAYLTWSRKGNGMTDDQYAPPGLPADQLVGKCICTVGGQVQIVYGDPVNTATGSFYLQATDLAAAAEGPPLVFGRTYVSLFTTSPFTSGGIFGHGWRHSYEAKLIIPDLQNSNVKPIVIYEAPTGNRLRFTREVLPNGTPVYLPFPGVRATLIETDNANPNIEHEFILTLRDGSQQVFDAKNGLANGRLKRQIDPQGREQQLTYYRFTSPLLDGQLSEVTDAASKRTLRFTYQPTTPGGTTPYLQKVELWTKPAAEGGNAITGQVVSFTLDAGRLDTVTDLRGGITNYDYQGTTALLTKVTDPRTKVQVENTYDPTTKRVTRQLDTNGVLTEYAYQQTTPQSPLTVDITVSQPTLVNGQLVAGTPIMELEHVYRPDGTLQQQSRAGRVVGYTTFGPSLEPTAAVDALGRGARVGSTPTGLPTRVTDTQGKVTTVTYNATQYPEVVVEPSGIKRIMLYDAAHNVRMERTIGSPTLPGGTSLQLTTYYTYTNGRLFQAQAPDGLLTRYEYTALGQVEKITTAADTSAAVITRYGYDALGRLETTIHGDNPLTDRTDKTIYNPDGTVQAHILNYDNGSYDQGVPDEDVRTDYGYDVLGRPLWSKTVDGRYHGYTRYTDRGEVDWTVENPTNSAGVPTLPSLTDPRPTFDPHYPDRNVSVDYTYDELGRVTLTTQYGLLGNTFNDDDDGDSQDERWFEDAVSRTTKTIYDPQGRVLETIQNYVQGQPVTVDQNVSAKSYYDAAGQLIWQGDHANRWTKYEYDTLGRLFKTIRNYENGNPETVDSGNWTWTNGTDTDLISFTEYQAATGWVNKTIANYVNGAFDLEATRPITDRISQPTYDSLGRVTLTTQNVTSNTWSGTNLTSGTTYDATTGRTLATSDALGVVTSLRYDAGGRVVGTIRNCRSTGNVPIATGCPVWSSTTPDRNLPSSTTGFDARGRANTVTDPLNYVTLTEYDAIDRVLWTTENYQSGQTATHERNVKTGTKYNGLSQVTETRDATNQPTTYTYDGVGSQLSVTDADNRLWRQGSDGLGQTRWSATLDGRLNVTLVDGLGRPWKTIQTFEDGIYQQGPRPTYDGSDQDLITTTSYDRAGRVASTINVMGRTTTYGYDQADRLIAVIENDVTACATPIPADCEVLTQYRWDRAGNQTAIIDGRGKVRTFRYDAADRLVAQTDAINRYQQFTYDAAGRRLTMGAYGSFGNLVRQLTWEYDQLGRLRFAYDPTQATDMRQEWTYTQRDQQHTWLDKTALLGTSGTITYGYDPLGRVTSADDPRTGLIGYGYSARGERTTLTYPGGETASYQYTPSGNLDLMTVTAGLGVVSADYAYDTAGRVHTVTKDGTVVTTSLYDDADRITSLTTTYNGTTRGAFTYTRNRAGSPTAMTRQVNGVSASYTYDYDALERLTTAYHGASYDRIFTYDRAGNRLTESQAGTLLTSRQYDDANQVTGWTYDAQGNLTNDGARTYGYDAFGRLTSVTNGTNTTAYAYHGEELLQHVENGVRTTLYTQDRADGLSKVIRIQRSGTKPLNNLPLEETVWYTQGAERIGVQANGNTRTYDIADALGTVHGTLQNGGVVTNHAFDPWGGMPSGNRQTAAGFTGEVQDSSTGLVYLRARWYNPATGTLFGKDPFEGYIRTPYSLHPYQYTYSNPLRYIDPTGNSPRQVTGQEGLDIEDMITDDFLGLASTWPGYTTRSIVPQAPVARASKYDAQGKYIDLRLVPLKDEFGNLICEFLEIAGIPTGNTGYVDILDTVKREVYEIKSIKSEFRAHAEIYWYTSFLTPQHFPGSYTYPNPKGERTIGPWPNDPNYAVRAKIVRGAIVYWGAKWNNTRDGFVEEYATEELQDLIPQGLPDVDDCGVHYAGRPRGGVLRPDTSKTCYRAGGSPGNLVPIPINPPIPYLPGLTAPMPSLGPMPNWLPWPPLLIPGL